MAGSALLEGGHPWFAHTDTIADASNKLAGGYVSFAHYDYLGLLKDPRMTAAAKAAIDEFGSGAGASRLVGGERTAHRKFEDDMAEFLGVGGVLALISGYLTNMSIISHFMGARDLVITDDLAHNSIVMGAKAGKFSHIKFRHNDLDHLEHILTTERSKYARVLIAAEGLYSMDGDLADLPRLVEIKDRHDAWLLLDEAHSYGVLGDAGRGLCERCGVDPERVELQIGTLSKSFASSGGFIAASKVVIDWLRFTLPCFVYSVGLSPATLATAQTALDILKAEPERVRALHRNSQMFLSKARAAGLDTHTAVGEAVIPVLFQTQEQTLAISQILLEQGIYAPPIIHVGVPKDLPRIRFFISAGHTEADIDRVVTALAQAAEMTADLVGKAVGT
ncbi:aminotransferase class I/II-fold pyridoxal phosphate-dependent enzyme [Pseudooceanicola sp.]|uniref:aminotransferase class I/II-fold pyridoxal phosphate-dependent enzyme n=1 Tax=Pseudooceanicola sp. TaxID=1914328 RepID=UPI00262FBC52|nr:aminotransferase class I/II-fold pyridoxal phosphate-dependent enzyme [Pseudooceanicola sp.]MDF1856021.1 aminotransferase class I/II-fold pyridoxal phosphate-dependent enzyme [Pseudooceanicola sp.]